MKLFTRLFCSLILITFLCACDSNTAPADTTNLKNADIKQEIQNQDDNQNEKKVIKLTAIDRADSWLPKLITDFNNNSEIYHVEITYYIDGQRIAITDGTGGYLKALDEALTHFNIELTTGNIPDIIITPASMQTNSYILKGLFADLNEFMDNDPDFNRADYLPSLFEIFDRSGKMYELSPLFLIYAIQAKTADVGTDIFWTLDEFASFIESKPDSKYIIGEMSKRDFIIKMVQTLFINPVSGDIKFDRSEFYKILSIAEYFPDQPPQIDHTQINEFMQGAKDGNPLMIPYKGAGFFNPKLSEITYFEEETTIKGWPSHYNNGIQFSPTEYISIMQPAENPDGAWELLKYILNNAKCSYGIFTPVNLLLLEKMAEEELERWKMVEPRLQNESVIEFADNFSREDIDKTMTLYKAASGLNRDNLVISSIIDEEIASYLNGQKPADTIIDIIENRIAIYLAEQN